MKMCCHPDGCDRPARARGWCRAHYLRVLRTGNPGTAAIPEPKKKCSVEDCDRIVDSLGGHGYCGKHYQRFRKHGDATVVMKGGASLPANLNPNWSETPSYNAVHLRLASALGKASRHSCVDCAGTAAEWSYDHTAPDEMQSEFGQYSALASHYWPRCVPCHRVMDIALLNGHREHLEGLRREGGVAT